MEIKTKHIILGSLFWICILSFSSYLLFLDEKKNNPSSELLVYSKSQQDTALQKTKSDLKKNENPISNEEEIRKKIADNRNNVEKETIKKNSTNQNPKIQKEGYWVQIAYYSKQNRKLAEIMVAKMNNKGIKGLIKESSSGEFRLVIGPFSDQVTANIEKNKIKEKMGIMDTFVFSE